MSPQSKAQRRRRLAGCWPLYACLLACGGADASDSTATSPAQPLTATAALGPYPLDKIAREVAKGQRPPCYPAGLVQYKGEVVPYDQPAEVHPAFRASLRAFEHLVVSTAREFYGRAPERILQMGAYRCRPNEKPRRLVSEHGLGNALDVAGFAFGPAAPGAAMPKRLPSELRSAFQVRVENHWNASGDERVHREFLRELARRVIARTDMFRVVLGPAYPDHQNHLHLDNAPYRLVKVF